MASSEELERQIRELCKETEDERQARVNRERKRHATGVSFSISVQGRRKR